jgi:hypothetical protein
MVRLSYLIEKHFVITSAMNPALLRTSLIHLRDAPKLPQRDAPKRCPKAAPKIPLQLRSKISQQVDTLHTDWILAAL